MALTELMVIDYLRKARSLKDINNHEVTDSNGKKEGQTPITIQLGKLWIQELIDIEAERQKDQEFLTQREQALISLLNALDSLPVSMSYQALVAIMTGLDKIQKHLFEAVNGYLDSVIDIQQNTMILKALVLVLKIIEYDLGKVSGPITVGPRFFPLTILTNEQREFNHTQVGNLIKDIIKRFDKFFETELISSNVPVIPAF